MQYPKKMIICVLEDSFRDQPMRKFLEDLEHRGAKVVYGFDECAFSCFYSGV
jgi:hypothetical protein